MNRALKHWTHDVPIPPARRIAVRYCSITAGALAVAATALSASTCKSFKTSKGGSKRSYARVITTDDYQ
jgi:hypothetical protein